MLQGPIKVEQRLWKADVDQNGNWSNIHGVWPCCATARTMNLLSARPGSFGNAFQGECGVHGVAAATDANLDSHQFFSHLEIGISIFEISILRSGGENGLIIKHDFTLYNRTELD